MGTAYLGYIDVALGRLDAGFRLLDEATAAAAAGEVPTLDALDVYCGLITACASATSTASTSGPGTCYRLSTDIGSDTFATFARTAWADALIWRGRLDETDAELAGVLEGAEGTPLSAAMAMVRRRPRGGLGRAAGPRQARDAGFADVRTAQVEGDPPQHVLRRPQGPARMTVTATTVLTDWERDGPTRRHHRRHHGAA